MFAFTGFYNQFWTCSINKQLFSELPIQHSISGIHLFTISDTFPLPSSITYPLPKVNWVRNLQETDWCEKINTITFIIILTLYRTYY